VDEQYNPSLVVAWESCECRLEDLPVDRLDVGLHPIPFFSKILPVCWSGGHGAECWDHMPANNPTINQEMWLGCVESRCREIRASLRAFRYDFFALLSQSTLCCSAVVSCLAGSLSW